MKDSNNVIINFLVLIRSVLVILQVITTLINETKPSKCITRDPDINRYKKRLREYGFNYYYLIIWLFRVNKPRFRRNFNNALCWIYFLWYIYRYLYRLILLNTSCDATLPVSIRQSLYISFSECYCNSWNDYLHYINIVKIV